MVQCCVHFLVLFSVVLLLTSRFLCYVMYCQEYAAAGTVKQNYVNILLMLLRLRQACDHPLLVRRYKSSSTWKSSVEVAKKLPQEKQVCLLKCLEDSLAICGICNVCVHLLVVFLDVSNLSSFVIHFLQKPFQASFNNDIRASNKGGWKFI